MFSRCTILMVWVKQLQRKSIVIAPRPNPPLTIACFPWVVREWLDGRITLGRVPPPARQIHTEDKKRFDMIAANKERSFSALNNTVSRWYHENHWGSATLHHTPSHPSWCHILRHHPSLNFMSTLWHCGTSLAWQIFTYDTIEVRMLVV